MGWITKHSERREKFCELLMDSLVNTNSGDGLIKQEIKQTISSEKVVDLG